jgi:hypothetical protein
VDRMRKTTMTERVNPIAPYSRLVDQLRRKSRGRREDQERMAAASSARPRRNDMLPRLELSYVPLEELRPSARKLRKLDPAHVREVASSISLLGFCDPLLIGRSNELVHAKCDTRRRGSWAAIESRAYASSI